MKLLPNFYQVGGPCLSHGFDATAYLLNTQNGLLLLDCGTDEGFEQIWKNIESLGFDPRLIKEIWGTHGHYDHVGAADRWKRETNAKLYLHCEDKEQVESGDNIQTTAKLLYNAEFKPVFTDGLLSDGYSRNMPFGKITVLHTPGHTMGSICFHLKINQMSVLVAGDTIWGGFSNKIGSDEVAWRKSLDKLCSMHFDMLTFGHTGPSLACDADARLKEARRSFAVYYNPWFKAPGDNYRY